MKKLLLIVGLLALTSCLAWAQEEELQPGIDSAEAATEYEMPPIGAISFLEIPALDPESASGFYAGLFGWTIVPSEEGEEVEGMVFFRDTNGAEGVFTGVNQPSSGVGCIFYITVDDVETKLGEIVAAGGTSLLEKTPLPNNWGYIGLFADTTGNAIGLWSAQ